MKYFWFFMAQLLLLSSCSNGDSLDNVDYSDDIVGAWYNEYYKEYDCFYTSGAYYCEIYTPYNDNTVLPIRGNYKLNGNKCILSYSYDGSEIIQTTNIIQSIDQTTFVCKGTENGELYTFTKVYDEITLEYGSTFTIRNLPFDAKIEKYESLSQGIVACTENGMVYSVFPGIGYVKVYTDKGNLILRVVVPDLAGFVLPDLSYILNKTASEVKALLGPAGLEMEDSSILVYYPNSNIVNELILYLNETTHKLDYYILELNKNIEPTTVIDYLDSKYTAIPLDDGDVMYQVNSNVVVFYEIEDNILVYMIID